MENDKETIYPSKIDWWIGLIMLGMPLIHIPLGLWVMLSKGLYLFGILLIFWGLIIGMIIVALSFPCRYILNQSTLTIRSGMVTDSFGLSRITEISPMRTLAAAPALSLDRVEIQLSDGTKRIISPTNQEEFVARIQEAIAKPKD